MAADAIETLISELKKLKKQVDALEERGSDTSKIDDRIAIIESKLSRDFGDWD